MSVEQAKRPDLGATHLGGDTVIHARSAIAGLPPLREVIARHGLDARKSLGQHFLLDLNVTRRIVRAAGDLSGVTVLEVGPGPGGLTRALLESEALQIVAVERDARCASALQELVAIGAGRLRLVEADALDFDAQAELPAPRAVVANLPYNVGTPLLIGWLRGMTMFRCLVLMFQQEVAERLAARPGGKSYGRLSVMAQWRARVEPVFGLPARAFTPPPKVASAIVRLTPRTDAPEADWSAMERIVAAAFGQRRKMLRTSLRPLGDADGLIRSAELDPTARAEDIDVGGFAALARAYAARMAAAAPPAGPPAVPPAGPGASDVVQRLDERG